MSCDVFRANLDVINLQDKSIQMLTSKNIRYLSTLLLYLCFSHTQAEVYQWTDANGRTHFGDRPPEKIDSKDISETLDKINITSDYSSPELMLRHEQRKDDEREKRLKEWQEKQKSRPSQSEKCAKARQHLKTITGRVVFVDENGKDLKISEESRKQRVQKLDSIIRKYCQ